jgi:formamidopyrimidine-DNA glycosylase
MPELPEVETVMRGLAKAIAGRQLLDVEVYSKRLRLPVPPA